MPGNKVSEKLLEFFNEGHDLAKSESYKLALQFVRDVEELETGYISFPDEYASAQEFVDDFISENTKFHHKLLELESKSKDGE